MLPSQPPLPAASPALQSLFAALAVVVALLVVAGTWWSAVRSGLPRVVARRHGLVALVVAATWVALTGGLAAAGLLRFDVPPTMLVLLPVSLASAVALGLSPVGARLARGLPLAALVGFQGFRVAVELLMHRAYVEGLMPVQMSYSGRNLDIVSGALAILVGAWLATNPAPAIARRVAQAWNVGGALLLANILTVAILSTPTPLRVFDEEPANVWIAYAPWVWLPTVLVFAALLGHVVVFRRLRAERGASAVLPATA
jgi:hypothetical protein